MGVDIKRLQIEQFVRHWNDHSYDDMSDINPNRFVSYDHFLAYIVNQVRYGTYDRHSQIELSSPPRPLVFPTYNHYNYVFCAPLAGSSETYYAVMRQLAKSSRRWVIDLTAITKPRDLLFWVLPFITHHNIIEFAYLGRNYEVSANICVVTGYTSATFPVSPWSEKLPWEHIVFVAGTGVVNLLIRVFADRGHDNYDIHIAEALIPRNHVATESVTIGDSRITLCLSSPGGLVNDKIVNTDLPADFWPYHP